MDRLNTYEKQTCLTATHYSQTTIPICKNQKECYLSLNSKLTISKSISKNINNKIEFYKNNLASSIFYFNESKTNLSKINKTCKENKFDKNLLNQLNSLNYNILNIFNYIDKNNKESIEILKDIGIFLHDQDINYISEEELYSDYITINNNLNNLRTNNNPTTNTYINRLMSDANKINYFARQLNFKNSYLSKINFIDLYSYYYDISTNPENTFFIPQNSLSTAYIINTTTKFESYRKFNDKLKLLEIYNLYLFFDKIIGFKNSTNTEFIELNNKINNDLDKIYIKIDILEEKINKDYAYLGVNSKGEFIKYKFDFKYNSLSLGKYLSKLKLLDLEINENKISNQKLKTQQLQKIEECNNLFTNNLKSINNYIDYLIKNYNSENNYDKKIQICEKIIKINNSKNNCSEIYALQNTDLRYLEIKLLNINTLDENECKYILDNIDYILMKNKDIKNINSTIKNIKHLIIENKKLNCQSEEVQIITSNLKNIENQRNYQVFLNKENILKNLKNYYNLILEINKTQLKQYLELNYSITTETETYFLQLTNPLDYEISNLELELNLENIISNTNNLKINKNNNLFLIKKLRPNINKLEINYNNNQSITTVIKQLNSDYSILEINITNTITGINSSINLGPIKTTNYENYKIDANNNLHFKTKKLNKILVYKKLLKITLIDKTLDQLTEKLFVEKTIYSIKSEYNSKINQTLFFDSVPTNAQIRVINNYKDVKFTTINQILNFNMNLDPFEETIYEIHILENIQDLKQKINLIISKKEILDNSIFINIKKKSKNILLPKTSTEELTIKDIKTIISKELEITNLWTYKEELENIENQFLINYNKTIELDINKEEMKKLNELYDTKYEDITRSYNALKILNSEIKNRLLKNTKKENTVLNEKLENLILEGENKNIVTKNTLDLYNKAKDENNLELKTNYFEIIKQEFDDKLADKCKTINDTINSYLEIDLEEFEDNLELLHFQYQEIDLIDLYNINYYPKITTYDLENITLNCKIINTNSFKDKINSFQDNYELENYSKAINIADPKFIENVEYIIEINGFITKTIQELDLKNISLIKDLENKSNLDPELLTNIKENYQNKKYLKNIYIINTINNKTPKNQNLLQTQNIIIILLFTIMTTLYFYFKDKPKKKINYKERKMKIIRHY